MRIPPLTSKKFLTKMLRENYFEEKFSIDSLNTQKSEVTSIMNVNLIPYEVLRNEVVYINLISR